MSSRSWARAATLLKSWRHCAPRARRARRRSTEGDAEVDAGGPVGDEQDEVGARECSRALDARLDVVPRHRLDKGIDRDRVGLNTPGDVHYGRAQRRRDDRARVLAAAHAAHPERFARGVPQPPRLPTAVWINKPPQSV